MRWTPDDVELLSFMYTTGHKVKELMIAFNTTEYSIRKKVERLGLKSPLMNKEKDGLYFCPICKKYKTKELFGTNSNKDTKYNIRTYCRECEKQYIRDLKYKKVSELYNPFIEKSKEEVYGASTKVCSCCKKEKDIEEFNWQNKYKKISSICKSCMSKKNKEYENKKALNRSYKNCWEQK